VVPTEEDDEDPDTTKLVTVPKELERPHGERERAYLIVLSGPNVGQMFPIEGDACVVGRGEHADIRLDDESISRRHSRIVVGAHDVRIEDLGSANGTLVNGARVAVAVLKDGDKIQLGETTILKFTYHDQLEETFQRKMLDAALRDPLTRVFNKKYLLDRLTVELAFARRHQTPLAVLMIDIDHFKQVNDTWGHLAGDRVLASLAVTLQPILRTEDLLARYGGEEFAIVCRGIATAAAAVLAERVRATVERAGFAWETHAIPVTISIGVAAFPSVPADDLLRAADEALYQAKHSGRNRVVVSSAR